MAELHFSSLTTRSPHWSNRPKISCWTGAGSWGAQEQSIFSWENLIGRGSGDTCWPHPPPGAQYRRLCWPQRHFTACVSRQWNVEPLQNWLVRFFIKNQESHPHLTESWQKLAGGISFHQSSHQRLWWRLPSRVKKKTGERQRETLVVVACCGRFQTGRSDFYCLFFCRRLSLITLRALLQAVSPAVLAVVQSPALGPTRSCTFSTQTTQHNTDTQPTNPTKLFIDILIYDIQMTVRSKTRSASIQALSLMLKTRQLAALSNRP